MRESEGLNVAGNDDHRSDEELLRRISCGECHVMATLVRRYEQSLLRFACRSLAEADGRDVVQQVFLKVFQQATGFRGESTVATWLYRIAYNAVADLHRNNVKRLEKPDSAVNEILAIPDPVDVNPGPLERLMQSEERELTSRAIDALSEDDRSIADMFYFHHLSHREIAELSGWTESKVNSYLNEYRNRPWRPGLRDMSRFIQPRIDQLKKEMKTF